MTEGKNKHPVDIHVGQRLRERRWAMRMTQDDLAKAVGIKFQQIQKYETGANRVSASRLWDISKALQCEIPFFFEGLDAAEMHTMPAMDKDGFQFLRVYAALPKEQRRKLFELAQVMSSAA